MACKCLRLTWNLTAQGTWMEKKVSTVQVQKWGCIVQVKRMAFRGTPWGKEEKDFRTCWVLYENIFPAEFGNGMACPRSGGILIWRLSVNPFPGSNPSSNKNMEQGQFKRLNGRSVKQIIWTPSKTRLQPGLPLLVEENGTPDDFSR